MSEDKENILHGYQLDSIKSLEEIPHNTSPSNLNHSFESAMGLTGISQSSAEYQTRATRVKHPFQEKTYTTQIRRISSDPKSEPSCD